MNVMRGYKKDIKRIVKEIKADIQNKDAHEASYTTSDGHYNLFLKDIAVDFPDDFIESTYFDIELNRNCDSYAFVDEAQDFDIRIGEQLEDCVKELLELATKTERSICRRRDGRVFQMFSALSGKPIPYSEGKRNYTKKEVNYFSVGSRLEFSPLHGNVRPVSTILERLA